MAAWIAGALYPTGEAARFGGGDGLPGLSRVSGGRGAGGGSGAGGCAPDGAGGCGEREGHDAVSGRLDRAAPACPLSAETAGDAVRFTGTAGPGVVAGVMVDGRSYAWRVPQVSTPGVVAAVLADMVRADRPAMLADATISFPQGRGVLARAAADGRGGQELRRQEARFRVTAWCPSPEARDSVVAFVDLALAGVAFLDVGGWGCRVLSAGSASHDEGAAGRVWRRELHVLDRVSDGAGK